MSRIKTNIANRFSTLRDNFVGKINYYLRCFKKKPQEEDDPFIFEYGNY